MRSAGGMGLDADSVSLRSDSYGTGRRLSDNVAAALLAKVTSGEYAAGDRLPPERVMAVRFGVSRTVIREAMKTLASRGVVAVRPGSGVFIAQAQASAAAESLRLLVAGSSEVNYEQVHEVRETLEVQIATLAAARATDEDRERLRRALDDSDTAVTGEDYARADGAFHLAIAELAHNQLFRIILEAVGDVMLEVRRRVAYVPAARERVTADHRSIAAAILRADPAGAGAEMERHLAHSREIVLELDQSVRTARDRSASSTGGDLSRRSGEQRLIDASTDQVGCRASGLSWSARGRQPTPRSNGRASRWIARGPRGATLANPRFRRSIAA